MIDLRSDTVTRPTDAMREAMAKAVVGDDGYGDDPSVNMLELRAASMLGKEAALLLPTGTMGNLCAVMAQTGRGEEIIVESSAHIYRSELGGFAAVASAPYRVLPSKDGLFSLDVLKNELEGSGGYAGKLRPALICVETTHNAAGGTVPPIHYLASVKRLAEETGAAIHMDGARVFNASIALSVDITKIVAHADTVMFCLSKGLGAPIGSMLCGPKTVINRARLIRKMLGGTMRQSGVIAAAGIVALETMVDRLADDHKRARILANGLNAIHHSLCDPNTVSTNILFVDVSKSRFRASEWCERLAARNIVCRPYSKTRIRLLTHADITDQDIESVLAAFAAEWSPAEACIA
ncbi:hypothetical protein G6M12_24785 [Agrobacterium tumefaciens]|uniref:GntG family PLP-dependent aldolase n=1 Tax=Agrobacterium fabrum TaxID=1176649 RepID=UPI00157412A8|nr:GntG family PLP-dependent aldolase [Agrobacterium fabrum]NTE84773.1 hypothetical protein [Agrobacterium tumefaciens]